MAGYLMKITVAHSPDSDDAFMHYGLASGKVPTDGIEFGHQLADIETLNRAAFQGTYEVSAVSFHAYAHLTDTYLLLPHGSSMGDDYGPIVVARKDGPSSTNDISVAIPGELTTAFAAAKANGALGSAGEVSADLAWAAREAVEILVQLFHPMMPHLAEECWAVLGHETLVAVQPWPAVEAELLREDTMTLPVQVNGKKRADVTIDRNAGNSDIEAAVLQLDAVRRALDGKPPKKVIVVPQRIVNVVA